MQQQAGLRQPGNKAKQQDSRAARQKDSQSGDANKQQSSHARQQSSKAASRQIYTSSFLQGAELVNCDDRTQYDMICQEIT